MAALVDETERKYQEFRRAFTLDVPEWFNFGFDVVDAWAARDPRRGALLAVGSGREHVEVTFLDLSRSSSRVANALLGLGAKKGDRALVVLPRVPEWYTAVLGMIKIGVLPIPTTIQATAQDLAYRIETAEATLAVVDSHSAQELAEIRDRLPGLREVIVVGEKPVGEWRSFRDVLGAASDRRPDCEATRSDDPLLIYFTSGTVAYPKMVLHTQASCAIGHIVTARAWQDLNPDDLHWTVSDMGWAKAAWGKIFGQWHVGAKVFLLDQRGKPDLELVLSSIGTHRVTSFCAPPTLYRAIVREDLSRFDFSSLRQALSAGEPLNPDVMRAWKEATGVEIREGYGQTETVCLCGNASFLPIKPGSMGRPMPTIDLAVVNDDGAEAAGEEGTIAVRIRPNRPVGLFREYWKDPQANSAAFRGDWYLTGDRGIRDADGYFWFVGRADDVIISASYRIGPFEVESALIEHPAVMEAAVIGKPDPERTAMVKAFIVLGQEYEPSPELAHELQEHCKRVTAPYKYPREIEFVGDLPKTISGKIRRSELRARELAAIRPSGGER